MATTTVSQSEFERALEALILEAAPPLLTETDITVDLLMKRAECGKRKARELLAKWEEDGKVVKGKRRGARGHIKDAWQIVTSEES